MFVSILTGPEEPVQLFYPFTSSAHPFNPFQSSPAPKSRCNGLHAVRVDESLLVSILTGPEEPVQHYCPVRVWVYSQVSILTGPEEPVQPWQR